MKVPINCDIIFTHLKFDTFETVFIVETAEEGETGCDQHINGDNPRMCLDQIHGLNINSIFRSSCVDYRVYKLVELQRKIWRTALNIEFPTADILISLLIKLGRKICTINRRLPKNSPIFLFLQLILVNWFALTNSIDLSCVLFRLGLGTGSAQNVPPLENSLFITVL